jgi:hypothetical protein
MLAPLATLAFLTMLWLVALVIADTFVRSRATIIAALNGRSELATATIRPIAARISQRSRRRPVLRAAPRLRAAA